ncbi:DUF5590 domain-containing protein [Paenibacillus lemnae]|uniref:DUF5590 domain-containing protein n=1 Tax=Paenibacillus lemnae TaxID=1330551 RepID=A0A848MAB5_PAELE|nr:DUF5590 domain-containing protein [Paenibacillus lemnae]NMO98007.1 DUF5590 domain-containing protein [Paenibacillus lemnae]
MKKNTKRILLTISCILLALLAVQIYYSDVMSGIWDEERAAVQTARQHGGLGKVQKTYHSVWDKDSIYWVAAGQDGEGQDIMVWIKFTEDGKPAGEQAVHAERISDGTSEQQIMSLIDRDLPGAEILRLLPGMYDGEYVWQLHYKNEKGTHYRFFRFQDGAPIGEDITLPNQG